MLYLVLLFTVFGIVKCDICSVCHCAFVNIQTVDSDAEENNQIITFKYKMEETETFNSNATYGFVQKFFYVDCSSDTNVGQINNLEWPKLQTLGILGNFKSSKWKKLEFFPDRIKREMTVLSLSENLIAEIEPFELDDFNNLKMLNLSENQVSTIKKSTFSKLGLLKILDLSRNLIEEIDDWAFHGTDLNYLNLSKNLMTFLNPETFRGLNNLSVLDLSDNKLTKLPESVVYILPSLTMLSIKGNILTQLPQLPSQLKKLDISRNQFSTLRLVHPKLQILDVADNEIDGFSHVNIPLLKVLRASRNNMSREIDLKSSQIEALDLSYNHFLKIPEDITSKNYHLLQKLYLDGNPINNVSFSEQNEPFRNMKLLSMSHCSIQDISKNSFVRVFQKNEVNCQREKGFEMNFSHNLIRFIDKDAFKPVSLCSVDFSHNELKTLSKEALPWKEMSHTDLQKNPWHCDCKIQWFLDDFLGFMYNNHPKLLLEMRCRSPLKFNFKNLVFWYNRSEQVFCKSVPSTIYLNLQGGKSFEIWTASAIVCVALGCFIGLLIVAILILVFVKPSSRKKKQVSTKKKQFTNYKAVPIVKNNIKQCEENDV